jgi:hypothetical protein
MRTHEWKVFLEGKDQLLADLREILAFGSPRLDRELGQYVLRSDELDNIDEPDAVENEATKILARCVALANIFLLRDGEIGVSRLHCEYSGHHHGRGPVWDAAIRVISNEAAARIEADTKALREGLASQIVHAASVDDRVAEVLSYMGNNEPGWPVIYLALEAVAFDLKAGKPGKSAEWSVIVERGWATTRDLNSVKQTANSYRHAKGFPLPQSPPPLPQAQAIMWQVVRAWLREKGTTA